MSNLLKSIWNMYIYSSWLVLPYLSDSPPACFCFLSSAPIFFLFQAHPSCLPFPIFGQIPSQSYPQIPLIIIKPIHLLSPLAASRSLLMIIGFRMGPLRTGDGCGVLDSISSCSEASSAASSDSDLTDEATSSSSSSSPPQPSSSSVCDPLRDMSSLMEQLPIKRGLSRYFQGKSQSFTSLSNVTSLEDLAKPENPYNKKLKSCRSYAGLADSHSSSSTHLPRTSSSSRLKPKKTSTSSSRVSCSSFSAKRSSDGSFTRPPMAAPPPPHRSASASSFNSNQTPLFA